jgi:hypothetical protein
MVRKAAERRVRQAKDSLHLLSMTAISSRSPSSTLKMKLP